MSGYTSPETCAPGPSSNDPLRLISKISLMIETLSSRPDYVFNDTPGEPDKNATPLPGDHQKHHEVVVEFVRVSAKYASTTPLTSEDICFLLQTVNYLTDLCKPATADSIAFSLLVSHRIFKENTADGKMLPENSQVHDAVTAYPEYNGYIKETVKLENWIRRFSYFLTGLVAIVSAYTLCVTMALTTVGQAKIDHDRSLAAIRDYDRASTAKTAPAPAAAAIVLETDLYEPCLRERKLQFPVADTERWYLCKTWDALAAKRNDAARSLTTKLVAARPGAAGSTKTGDAK